VGLQRADGGLDCQDGEAVAARLLVELSRKR
jgi:hypothetical protein